MVRGLGLALTAVLLGASIFTIASVVRLTSYLYRDEIAVMRLVGATEFYIRGPFYVEGLFQGLLGARARRSAGSSRRTSHAAARAASGRWSPASSPTRFLSPLELAALVDLGAVAGLAGAVVSLGRENAGERPLGKLATPSQTGISHEGRPARADRGAAVSTGPVLSYRVGR